MGFLIVASGFGRRCLSLHCGNIYMTYSAKWRAGTEKLSSYKISRIVLA
jgi:hypothetical protein